MLSDPSSQLALQALRLEQRLESYQRLHEQELDDLRRAVADVKARILDLAAAGADGEVLPVQPDATNDAERAR